MRAQSKYMAIIIVAVFFVGIGASMAFNLWRTTSSKIPARYKEGEHAGEYNPGDIRGSYAFSDVSAAFKIPVEDLAKAFGLADEANPGELRCKDLEARYGATDRGEVGVDSVRYFVALYTGLPYTPEESTLLLSPALSLLRDKVGEQTLAEVRERTITVSAAAASGGASAHEGSSEDDRTVKGKTTFGELLQWGVTREEIEAIPGLKVGKSGETVRDWCVDNDLEFPTVKEKLQQLVDAHQKE